MQARDRRNLMRPLVFALALLALPSAALADPVGKFKVRGANPSNQEDYTGVVKISRTGDAYKVVWKIGDGQTIGTALGGRMIDGRLVLGPASAEDTVLSVAYGSGDTFGTAFYVEQPDGSWKGTWTSHGAQALSTEDWLPAKPKVVETVTEVDSPTRDIKPLNSLSSPMPAVAGPRS
jgi:hypothetical protein